jgi:hypothetical protein
MADPAQYTACTVASGHRTRRDSAAGTEYPDGLVFQHTLTLPLRHCTQATAIACRRFLGSGAARCWPGSSVAGAMGCHRSVGSMGGFRKMVAYAGALDGPLDFRSAIGGDAIYCLCCIGQDTVPRHLRRQPKCASFILDRRSHYMRLPRQDGHRDSDKFFRLLCRAKYPSGELVLANERLRSYMLPGALDRVQSESWCPPLQR